ncbi:MAG: GlxA family transcriptional regulator [Alphaproteobacteria bacterium]|nr:GlxA family transcriptional regulator [Alphaproteobacteria bacterium]
MKMRATGDPEQFGFLLLPSFSMMAFASAVEPLRAANTIAGSKLYEWTMISMDGQAVPASNSIDIMPNTSVATEKRFDYLFVVGGTGAEKIRDPRALNFVRKLTRVGTVIGAVSTAPYLLAYAGLLDNKRCTIHWEYIDSFREDFPHLDITEELFEIDGQIITCSGGTASIDLLLHLISHSHGHDLATHVSEWFLHKQIREQSEHQRMALRFRVGVSHPKLLSAIQFMEENLETPLEREEIAEVVGLSTRQLERLFRKYLNSTPRKYYFGLRMQRARILLRQTSMSVLDVALASGFVSASHFAKCYREFFGHSPRRDRAPEA